MTRPLYSDLILSFTPGSSTNPSTTKIASLITRLFELAYGEINETYVAETAHTIIDTQNVYSAITADAQVIVETWYDAQKQNSQTRVARIELSQHTKDVLHAATKKVRHLTKTVRLWNSESDWS